LRENFKVVRGKDPALKTAGAPTSGGSDDERQSACKPRSVPPEFTTSSILNDSHHKNELAFFPGLRRSSI